VTPPAPNPPDPEVEPKLTVREWLAANGTTLAILGALFIFLWVKFDYDGLWAIFKAALGLGLVIFIHELGHFLAAKWCDVHVTVFSVGFGPAIPGCSFKRGETTYKLALFPLGGYVQMVGQVDGDESADDSEDDPRSFRNKGVGQRMLIISAGVIMNVILAVVCFIIVFRGPGKDRKAGVIDQVDTGAPAYKYGARSGDAIKQIGDVRDPFFEDLMVTVMGSDTGERLKFVFADPGAKPGGPGWHDVDIEPRKARGDSRPIIGITPPFTAQLDARRYYSKSLPHPARPHTAAASASPPFEFGDRIVATTKLKQEGKYDPNNTEPLPPDLRWIESQPADQREALLKADDTPRNYFELARRLSALAGKEMVIEVKRDGTSGTLKIRVPAAYHRTFGAQMEMGQVTAVRNEGKAAKAGVIALDASAGRLGDKISWVAVREPDGRFTVWTPAPPTAALLGAMALAPDSAVPAALVGAVQFKALDPFRLPDEMVAWSRRMAAAGKGAEREVTLHVWRTDTKKGPPSQGVTLQLGWDAHYENNREIPMGVDAGISVPGLGLVYRVEPTVVGVEPGTSALRPGDVIKDIKYKVKETPDGEARTEDWVAKKNGRKALDGTDPDTNESWAYWSSLGWMLQRSPLIEEIVFKVQRAGGKEEEVTVRPYEAKDWGLDDRGLILAPDMRRQWADGTWDAIVLGLKDTKNSIIQVYQNLRGMIIGRISVENLGGPVTIARVAYHFAGIDFWEFVFFLGLISVNLAVINFLPIPVLDGGHMVFLIYEKLRGKPASEGVRVGATYAGLLLLASLMIFVLFLDIKRLF
jgi:regulator of sigma E protease